MVLECLRIRVLYFPTHEILGLEGGPIVFFDENWNTVVFSSLTNFKIGLHSVANGVHYCTKL